MPSNYKSDGCGSSKARFNFVPDTIYGLSLFEACRLHDWAYGIGGTELDRQSADREFLTNILMLIDANEKWYYPTWLARRRAMTYYDAVVRFGSSSFNYSTN